MIYLVSLVLDRTLTLFENRFLPAKFSQLQLHSSNAIETLPFESTSNTYVMVLSLVLKAILEVDVIEVEYNTHYTYCIRIEYTYCPIFWSSSVLDSEFQLRL